MDIVILDGHIAFSYFPPHELMRKPPMCHIKMPIVAPPAGRAAKTRVPPVTAAVAARLLLSSSAGWCPAAEWKTVKPNRDDPSPTAPWCSAPVCSPVTRH